MKKIILFLFTGLIGFLAPAQNRLEDDFDKISLHVKSGWLRSTLKGKDIGYLAADASINPKNSFFIGIEVYNPIHNRFGFKHEIQFLNRGGSFLREIEGTGIDAELKMRSLRLYPVSLSYSIAGFEPYAGPYLDILLNSSVTAVDENGKIYRDHSIFGTEYNDQNESKFLQQLDYGFVAGVEYHFGFGGLVGINFSKGFASIFDNSNTYEVENNQGMKDLRIYNQNFGIYIGYAF